MAGLPAKIRVQPSDVKAAALWGVTAATAALYLVQVFSFFVSIFLRKIISDVKDSYAITLFGSSHSITFHTDLKFHSPS
jgi:hypothetical protein